MAQDIPAGDDSATYDLICRADTMGVFQIESSGPDEHAATAAAAPLLRPGD